MKKMHKSILGVTLLEIMLVLAIAAMIIVMSVRYYQTANSAQQANMAVEQLSAIAAAGDSIAQANGAFTTSNMSGIVAILPVHGTTTPWNTSIVVGGAATTSFTISVAAVPSQVCPLLRSRMLANPHFTSTTSCSASAATAITFTYTENP